MSNYKSLKMIILCLYAAVVVTIIYKNRDFNPKNPKTRFYPKYWNELLQFSTTLKLVLIDASSLECTLGKDNVAQACYELSSAETTRIGNYLPVKNFVALFNSHALLQSVSLLGKWFIATIPEQHPDTVILKHRSQQNTVKFVIVTSLKRKHGQNYYVLRGARNLKTIGIRQFRSATVDISNILGHKMCENKCEIMIPSELDRHLMYLKAGPLMECNQKLASFNLQDAKRRIPAEAIGILTTLIDKYLAIDETPFMCHRTFLGWYRNCGVIPQNHGYEFCISEKQHADNFPKQLNNMHHSLRKLISSRDGPLVEMYNLYHGISSYDPTKLDVLYMYDYNSTFQWTPHLIKKDNETKTEYYVPNINKLCTADIDSHLFFAPCNIQSYLDARYDTTWDLPNTKIGYCEPDVENGIDCEWHLKRQNNVVKRVN